MGFGDRVRIEMRDRAGAIFGAIAQNGGRGRRPERRFFSGSCPLSCRFRPLYPQEQTFLVVPPFVWF